jgi:predicted ABC-type ATPase
MPWRTDEHGEIVLDPSVPADMQLSQGRYDRWKLCEEYASRVARKPAGDPEVTMLARSLFRLPFPTFPKDVPRDGKLIEADADDFLEPLHPRNRMGRWIDKPRVVLPKKLRGIGPAPHPKSPGTGIDWDEIVALGLDKSPRPSAKTHTVLGKYDTTVEMWAARRKRTDQDPVDYGTYKVRRRHLHDRIIGRELAIPIGNLLGPGHPIAVKLSKGGRLSAAEKEQVRAAADEARGGEAPDALFLAGGTATGKSTMVDNNPELLPRNHVRIDPDRLKIPLPEYQKLTALNDHYAASAVHRESGDIAARLAHEAEDLGLNVVIDGTGDSDPGEFLGHLMRKKAKGYDVEVLYVNLGTNESINRSVARAETEKRWVPIPAIRDIHRKVSINFVKEIEKARWLFGLDVFDETGHIGTMVDGDFVDLNPAQMKKFRDKRLEPAVDRG